MIKRDGVAVMNARTKNVMVAKETLGIVSQGNYKSPNGTLIDLAEAITTSINGTILYKDTPHSSNIASTATIEVVNETTALSAKRLLDLGKEDIVALNFASARNQGGGFLAGAIAQEEDLCRCSGLYSCLKRKPVFYNENILCEDTFYTDNMIYSPEVPFFRDQYNNLLEQPYKFSIISAPAPNVRAMTIVDEKYLRQVLYNRALKILRIARAHQHKVLILGAWGCGAFGNDAEMVANVFLDALVAVPAFEHVCFAVYDSRPDQILFETFRNTINQ